MDIDQKTLHARELTIMFFYLHYFVGLCQLLFCGGVERYPVSVHWRCDSHTLQHRSASLYAMVAHILYSSCFINIILFGQLASELDSYLYTSERRLCVCRRGSGSYSVDVE